MGRKYLPGDVLEAISGIRERFPDVTISTDVITGFPGEKEEDHISTIELIGSIRPDILNITRFSRRKGTPADRMNDQVPGWLSKERSREITRIHGDMVMEKLKTRLGVHRDCLVTEVGKRNTMMARDENYTPIVLEGERELMGRFIDIKTNGTGPSYLLGKMM
jgi:tRNA A37 methylthiotransferase MiaB